MYLCSVYPKFLIMSRLIYCKIDRVCTLSKNQLFASIEAGTADPPKAGQIPECLLERKADFLCVPGVGVLGDRGWLVPMRGAMRDPDLASGQL
jgi:hypothetical protein